MGDAPAAYAVTADGPQGLCCVWNTGLAHRLGAILAGGEHPSVHGFLEGIGGKAVAIANADAFRNVNTVGDVAALEREIGAPPP